MRYEPVKLRRFTRRQYKVVNGVEVFVGATSFWQVRGNMVGDCGHQHKTEGAADKCNRRLRRLDAKLRSERQKAGRKNRVIPTDILLSRESCAS